MWQSLSRYHPRIGYTFMPSVKSRIPCETGGYLFRTNSTGFRSDHEFPQQRTPNKFRALLFGDSQTAGDGVSNGDRFSDLLERELPNLEINNYGIPGTSPDQHYLTYLEFGGVEHDLLILAVFVENVGRVAYRFMPYSDATGKEVIYAKPYWTMENGQLELHHVPVPKAGMSKEAISPEDQPYVYGGVPFAGLRTVVKRLGIRDLMQKITKFQPVPDYDSPDNPRWLLLRRIIEEWVRTAKVPALLVPIPMWPFIEESSDPTNYQKRFQELAQDLNCHYHDPLPDLWKYPQQDRRGFRFQSDSHLTPKGHRAVANSLLPVVQQILTTLPARSA